MRISTKGINKISGIAIDSDINMGGLYQLTHLASPASGEALRKGNQDIANAEVADAAGITYAKLLLTNKIKNADILAATGIVYSKLNLLDKIKNADVKSDAAIAITKLVDAVCSETEAQAYAAAAVTKEILLSVCGWAPDTKEPNDPRGVWVNTAGNRAYLRMLIPQDFTSITALEVIFNPTGTGASMHFDFTTYFGVYVGGEAYNEGTETAEARDIGATVLTHHLAHDITDLVTGLAAGDLLNVCVAYNATAIDSDAYVTALRLKYT